MRKFRLLALVLALILLCGSLPVLAAETGAAPLLPKVWDYPGFADVKGSWCETAVKTVYEAGLMEGAGKGKFGPQGQLSNQQIIVVAARLFQLLNPEKPCIPEPEKGEAWYQPSIVYLQKQVPDCPLPVPPESYGPYCTRRTFIGLLSSVLTASAVSLSNINQLKKTSFAEILTDEALTFYNAGILSGVNAYGALDGQASMTRATAAAMLARILDPAQRLRFTPKPFDLCAVLGVQPEEVLFLVDGQEVTAGQCVLLLANRITTTSWGEDYSFAWAENYALNQIKKVFAVRILAEKLGISLDETDRSAMEAEMARWMGLSSLGADRESWLWLAEHKALYNKVRSYYTDNFPSNNAHGFSDAYHGSLIDTMDTIPLERTEAANSKALAAFRVKLIASKYYDFHMEAYFEE